MSSLVPVTEDTEQLWNYFVSQANKESADCKLCGKVLKTTQGNTTGLRTHLKTIHKLEIKGRRAAQTPGPSSGGISILTKKAKITDHFSTTIDKSLEAVLARMTARDGLPFSIFVTSIDLREALRAKGFDLPKSASTIKAMVMEYGKKIRIQQIQEIGTHLAEGKKLSQSFDEWSSSRNRRYMNINLHAPDNKFWNLGLIRIRGSLTSNKCLELVEEKLLSYRIILKKDIVSAVTDGPSVMVKLGKLLPTHHQRCFAHGIQLAVLDVLYKQTGTEIRGSVNERGSGDSGRLDTSNSMTSGGGNELANDEHDQHNSESGSSESESEGDAMLYEEDNAIEIEMAYEIKPIVQKIRKIVKLFKRSPLKNEILQKHAKNDLNQELKLILDSKTRWNSLLAMLERFQTLGSSVKKSLIDIKSTINIEDLELDKVAEIVNCLQPMTAVVEALCRRDANLLTATAALKFAISKLESQDSALSKMLSTRFKYRMKERVTDISSVLQFLHTSLLPESNDEILNAISIKQVAKIVKDLISRLYPNSVPETTQDIEMLELEPECQPMVAADSSSRHIKKKPEVRVELDEAISTALSAEHKEVTSQPTNLTNAIKREITLFQQGGSRGHHLQLAYDSLKTIPPTSVESERIFSSAGYLCSKIRSSLNDDTLDQLCLLRTFFRDN